MSPRFKRALPLVIVIPAWLLLAAWRGNFGRAPRASSEEVRVLHVLDGDTYRHPGGGLIRLLGVDTPERSAPWFEGDQEPWASRASEFARTRIASAEKVQVLTHGERDTHGRLLAHVLVDGEALAVLLAEAGLAYPTLQRYGHGGFPQLARQLEGRARAPTFEAPWRWRRGHRKERAD